MWPPRPISERFPQLWFLLGLLFIATGLYLGFEFSMSFVYVLVGFFCCVFGIALFILRMIERPKIQLATQPRKPIQFDSANQLQPNPAPVDSKDEEPAAS